MKKIIKLGLILLLISTVAAAALAYTYEVTAPTIETQRKTASELARKEVLPTADSFKSVSKEELKKLISASPEIVEAFYGLSGTETVGYVIKSTPKGFGGPIEVVAGIGMDGLITGVRLGKHQETPGLGTVAKTPGFYEQYNGMKTDQEIGVNKNRSTEYEIQAISGATITSRGVTAGVNIAIKAVETLSGK